MTGAAPLLFLSDADTARLLAWPDVIACLAAAYGRPADPAATPPRTVARLDGAWLRAMAAMSPSRRVAGAKVISRSRAKRVSYLIALWDQETSELVCLLDGRTVTAMRTAGTSAVAVDRMLPPGPVRLAVLGSGHEAGTHVSAMAAVRPVESLTVFSPTPANRERFAQRFAAELGVPCTAAATAREAVAGATLVVAAARSHDETAILEGAWLVPGQVVVSIGSTVPEQREVDPEVIRRAEVIVADVPEEVAGETGDMIAAHAAGVDFAAKIVPLADLVQGKAGGRQRAGGITLFKSVGAGLQDIAVSEMCYEKALRDGVGTRLAAGLAVKGGKKG